MSGGSYNYLCITRDEQLFEYGAINTLEQMSNRLIELGHEDAAKETYELKLIIQQAKLRANTISERMNKVWKAVEWYDSADWGKDSVDKAISNYRGDCK
ncbi:MAG: hypothetical protein NAG76_22610 [Candidatus Pristimantibacillus lignocellulolyticus]|uniref:Uncharacterized protein n=1 Tax=Candidatus Pristimantibacillus lignocellulolyticus TaxID=2994561 RepID=A0A9J6ZEU0_9BACL|nr:MAG: hypothetical protein NAG76_22610 [Candidatus Pristimantibacillus lignocellulolyticus]